MNRFFLLILLFLLPGEVLGRPSVHFHDRAVVAGPRIMLGDIAAIRHAGENTEAIARLPVASSPPPGKTKDLYTVSVINSLRNQAETADIDWQGSPTIVVERKGNRISRKQIEAILGQYLQENRDKLPKAEIHLTVQRAPEELIFPVGALSWKVMPSRPDILGSTSFSISFAVDGQAVGNCVIRGRLKVLGEVAVAAMPLRKGDLLAARSVRLAKQDLADLKDPYPALDQVLGKEMARTVNSGTILDQGNVVAPAVVKEGDMVKIVARKGALQITASGLARADGRQGERIRVKNIGTNKLVYCRVDGPGMVSVEF
jgi:flagella basal body P-ring formation protein FlgA